MRISSNADFASRIQAKSFRRVAGICSATLLALGACFSAGAAAADEPTPGPSVQYDPAEVNQALIDAANGIDVTKRHIDTVPGAQKSAGTVTPLNTGHGNNHYVTSISSSDVFSNVTLRGNAVGLPSPKTNHYYLEGVVLVNGSVSTSVGPVNILHTTSGTLPTWMACMVKGVVVGYQVGLLNATKTAVIDITTSAIVAGYPD